MKQTIFALLVWMLAVSAHAQTSATYNARVEGTSNCRKIVLSVTRQTQNGGTTTNLSYAVLDCPSGSQVPSVVVVQGNQAIPNGDYMVKTANGNMSHELRTSTNNGPIQLRWQPTSEHQNSYAGTWIERNGSSQTRTEEQQQSTTARVDGVLNGITLAGERPGWFSSTTQTVR